MLVTLTHTASHTTRIENWFESASRLTVGLISNCKVSKTRCRNTNQNFIQWYKLWTIWATTEV